MIDVSLEELGLLILTVVWQEEVNACKQDLVGEGGGGEEFLSWIWSWIPIIILMHCMVGVLKSILTVEGNVVIESQVVVTDIMI